MTPAQERLKAQYRQQLRKCGFRSWKAANARRGYLIELKIAGTSDTDDDQELDQLQHLADLYARYKTNDSTGRAIRSLKHLAIKLLKPP